MNRLITVTIATLGLIMGSAWAGEEKTLQEQFNELDVNRDGVISQVEVEARPDLTREMNLYSEGSFERADLDDSGTLDQSEFSAFEMEIPAE